MPLALVVTDPPNIVQLDPDAPAANQEDWHNATADCIAPIMPERAATLALELKLTNLGMAVAARMPSITIATTNSTKVNPLCLPFTSHPPQTNTIKSLASPAADSSAGVSIIGH